MDALEFIGVAVLHFAAMYIGLRRAYLDYRQYHDKGVFRYRKKSLQGTTATFMVIVTLIVASVLTVLLLVNLILFGIRQLS